MLLHSILSVFDVADFPTNWKVTRARCDAKKSLQTRPWDGMDGRHLRTHSGGSDVEKAGPLALVPAGQWGERWAKRWSLDRLSTQ